MASAASFRNTHFTLFKSQDQGFYKEYALPHKNEL